MNFISDRGDFAEHVDYRHWPLFKRLGIALLLWSVVIVLVPTFTVAVGIRGCYRSISLFWGVTRDIAVINFGRKE